MSIISVVIIIRIEVIFRERLNIGGRAHSVFPHPRTSLTSVCLLTIVHRVLRMSVRPYYMCSILDVMSRLERFGFKPTIQLLVNVTFRAEEQPQACDRTEHSYVSKLPKFKVAAPQERRRPRMSRFVQFIYVIFLLFYVDRQL